MFLIVFGMSTTLLYVLFGVLTVFFLVLYFILKYYIDRVDGTSIMLRSLDTLNKKYKFHKDIKKSERITRACNSKKQFERTDLEDYLLSIILEKVEYYDALISRIETNKTLFKEYLNEYKELKSSANKELAKKYFMPLFIYKMLEKRIVKIRKLAPRMDTEFIVRATYVSPKGKNNYQKTNIFYVPQIKKVIEKAYKQVERKQTKEYQRMIMSDKLRYEILHRDKFKCQLCGATSKDGAKLHVDHIVPIAKGGKTETSNLRTLCDRCNMGKGSKIERV